MLRDSTHAKMLLLFLPPRGNQWLLLGRSLSLSLSERARCAFPSVVQDSLSISLGRPFGRRPRIGAGSKSARVALRGGRLEENGRSRSDRTTRGRPLPLLLLLSLSERECVLKCHECCIGARERR